MANKGLGIALAKLAKEHGLEPLAYVCSRIAGGDFLADVARDIGFSRTMTSSHVNALPGAKDALKVARAEGAHAMYEEAINLWKEVEHNKEAISVVKGHSDTLLWGAQRLGRTEFGEDRAQITLNMNVGSLTLDAMRKRVLPDVSYARLIEAPSIIDSSTVHDATIISDDDTST